MVDAKYERPDDEVSLEGLRFTRSKYTRNEKILAVLALVLLLLWIIFLSLFIHERKKYNDCATVNYSGQEGGGGVEPNATKVPSTGVPSTEVPSTEIPATSVAPTSAAPYYGEGPWEHVRLPKYARPIHYDLVLKVNIDQSMFSGSVTINVSLSNVSDYMYLHTNKLNISNPELEKNDGTSLPLKRDFWYKKNQFYVLDPKEKLAEGYYRIKMDFVGKLENDLKGLYKSSYKNKNGDKFTMASTQLQPTDARKVFPCFDEPSYKATFQVAIYRPKDMISITNTPLIRSDRENDGMVADYYHKTVVMPTYLLAFVVCDFAYEQEYAGQRNSSMRYYAAKEQLDQTKLARDVGGKILEKFENYFGIEYPLRKADMIAIPDFAAGAMENWGLITYRETALLFKDGESSESNKERVTLVISHELAHMWFGNLVTTEWWDDLWLNEGFASFVEYIGIDHVFPEWKIKDIFVITDMRNAFSLDGLVTSHPILLSVNHPDEINEIFDSISYSKGAAILRMLQYFLGEDVFRNGLTNYLKYYSYGNAKTKDLWRFLTNASREAGSDIDVAKIMDTWTLQMNYPVVTVAASAGKIVLTQQRFLSDPSANTTLSKYNSTFGYKWHIPFTIAVRDSNSSKEVLVNGTDIAWMSPEKGEVKVKGATWNPAAQWVKGNLGHTGFYLVNYPTKNWELLSEQLQQNHKILSISDRAGLIQDAFSLADAEQLDYKYALGLTQYLDKETDYVPWSAGFDGISSILGLLPSTSPSYKRLKDYRFNKIKPRLDSLGYNDTGGHLEKYLRGNAIIAACSLKNEKCLKRMKEYFDNWIKNDTEHPVPANLRTLVYFYGMSQSGEREWDIAFKRFQETNVASERRKILFGLAGINEPWLLVRYLEYAFDKTKVKSQDTSSVISYVANSNPIGRHFAWSFIKEKWPVIFETYGGGLGFALNSFISSVASRFNSQWELEQVEEFYANNPDSGSGSRAREQVLERIKSRIAWRKENEASIKEWLDNNNI